MGLTKEICPRCFDIIPSHGECRCRAEMARQELAKLVLDMHGYNLYHGDLVDVLPTLGVKPDLILTSPPYGDSTDIRRAWV